MVWTVIPPSSLFKCVLRFGQPIQLVYMFKDWTGTRFINLISVKQAFELRFVFKQQGWPAGTQQILIPSTWQQMSGMSIHNPSQAVVPESPMGAPVPNPQQAPEWRWVQSDSTRLHVKCFRMSCRGVWLLLYSYLLSLEVAMAANLMVSTSRTLVQAVTLPPRIPAQERLRHDPSRARGRRLDRVTAEPGISLPALDQNWVWVCICGRKCLERCTFAKKKKVVSFYPLLPGLQHQSSQSPLWSTAPLHFATSLSQSSSLTHPVLPSASSPSTATQRMKTKCQLPGNARFDFCS